MNNFKQLSSTIEQVHRHLQANAASAVNQALTIRNFLVGYYIVTFEQNGEDRAAYGTNLLGILAKNIAIKGLTAPELSRCRQFYQCYPQIFGSVTQKFHTLLPEQIVGPLLQYSETGKLEEATNQHLERPLQVPAEKIISKAVFYAPGGTHQNRRSVKTHFLRDRMYEGHLERTRTETPDKQLVL